MNNNGGNVPEATASGCRASEWCWLVNQLRPEWRLQMLSIIALLGASLLWLVDPLIIRWLIDQALPKKSTGAVAAGVGLFCVACIGRFVFTISSYYIATLTTQRLILRLRRWVSSKIHQLRSATYEVRSVGELVYHLEQDVDQVGNLGADVVPTLIRILVTSALTVTMMLELNWRLTLVALGFLPVSLVLGYRFRRTLEQAAIHTRGAVARRSSFVTESLTGVTQVQVLSAVPAVVRRYIRVAVHAMRTGLSERKKQLSYSFWSLATIAAATAAVLGAGGHLVISGLLSIGSYVAFYSYLLRLFDPLNSAIDMHSRLQKGRASIRKLIELSSEYSPLVDESRTAQAVRKEAVPAISFNDVYFSYPNNPVLKGFTLRVNPGETVALVGPSGSGKSTVAKLLLCFYEADRGVIYLNDDDISRLSIQSVRQTVGFVPQDPVIFEGTIRENLMLGHPSATESDIERAIYVACLENVLSKLPKGLDSTLGPFGAGLSGGERQRLALARMFLRNYSVLVLDEVTSGLDATTKRVLLWRIRKHLKPVAILVISHDVTAFAWADRIVELRNGRPFEGNRRNTLDRHRNDPGAWQPTPNDQETQELCTD